MKEILTAEQEIEALLNWNPPPLPLAKTGTRTKHSQHLSHYDRHLDDSLILKEVKPMASLLQDIANVVDRAIASIRDRKIAAFPPQTRRGDVFCTAADRESWHAAWLTTTQVRNARDVANFYAKTTAAFCVPVASTLALHPRLPSWSTLLEFGRSDVLEQAEFSMDAGTADGGVLRVIPKIRSHFTGQSKNASRIPVDDRDALKFLDSEAAEGLAEMSKRFAGLGVWEFASLSAGSQRVMQAVLALSDGAPFPWVKCTDPDCGRHETTSGPDHNPVDATATPWEIPSETTQRRSTRLVEKNQQLSPKSEPPSSPQFSSELPVRKGKRKREIKDEGGDSDEGDPDVGELTAEMFIQQAWARAVLNDATVICLQAGSSEYIGIRHRATQRLYISDVVRPHDCENPRYGKLHVGLFIMAVEDAMNRAMQLSHMDGENEVSGLLVAQPSGSSHNPEPEYLRGNVEPKRQKSGGSGAGKTSRSGQHSRKDKGKGKEKEIDRSRDVSALTPINANNTFQQFVHETGLRKVVWFYLVYGIYNSPVPGTFIRPPLPKRPVPKGYFRDDECMTLILISEIAHGATGKTHGGTLEVETASGQTLSERVVAKLAFSSEQRDDIRNEYMIYQHLALKRVQGVPTVVGIFDDLEGAATMLLMTHAGTCLRHDEPVSSSQRAEILSALRGIHRAGVLHYDLRLQNLLVNERGEVSIIDFDQSIKGPSSKQMKHEYRKLEDILDNMGAKLDG